MSSDQQTNNNSKPSQQPVHCTQNSQMCTCLIFQVEARGSISWNVYMNVSYIYLIIFVGLVIQLYKLSSQHFVYIIAIGYTRLYARCISAHMFDICFSSLFIYQINLRKKNVLKTYNLHEEISSCSFIEVVY